MMMIGLYTAVYFDSDSPVDFEKIKGWFLEDVAERLGDQYRGSPITVEFTSDEYCDYLHWGIEDDSLLEDFTDRLKYIADALNDSIQFEFYESIEKDDFPLKVDWGWWNYADEYPELFGYSAKNDEPETEAKQD